MIVVDSPNQSRAESTENRVGGEGQLADMGTWRVG